MRDRIDYDSYYAKHCARYYGWLPAIRRFKKHHKKKIIKYFTLCAEQAIDVFMLELEGILSRDKAGKLTDVIICEKDREVATRILNLVRPPLREAIVIGPLEKILTFQDDNHTSGLSPDADHPNRKIREKLRIKKLHQTLKSFFPFDIINFDTYGNILNPQKETNRLLMEALEKIFLLQKVIDSFLLLLTVPISDIAQEYLNLFENTIRANVDKIPEIQQTMEVVLGTTNYEEIEELKKVSLGFAKAVTTKVAHANGWKCKHEGIYVYENKAGRMHLSAVVLLTQNGSVSDDVKYIQDIIHIIKTMPNFYEYQSAETDENVKLHLKQIVDFREKQRIS